MKASEMKPSGSMQQYLIVGVIGLAVGLFSSFWI